MVVPSMAKRIRVWICRPGEDTSTGFEVTDYCSGGTGGYVSITEAAMGDDGNKPTTGQVVLDVPHFDDRFSSWENPTRWAKGNHVILHVDSATGFRSLPRGYLYILSIPEPPVPGNWQVQLELGDWGTLNSQSKPKSDTITGESIGTGASFSRAEAISSVLPVGVASESLGESLTKSKLNSYQTGGRSTIGVVAEMALPMATATYQDGSGKVSAVPMNLTPEKRLFKHTVGTDDAGEFKFLQGDMQPIDSVTVRGSVANAADDSDDGSGGPGSGGSGDDGGDTGEDGDDGGFFEGGGTGVLGTDGRSGRRKFTRYLSADQIDPDGSSAKVPASITVESWGWVSESQFVRRVEEKKARGLVVSEELYDIYEKSLPPGVSLIRTDAFQLIPSLVSTEMSFYEPSDGGRLLKQTFESYRPSGEVLADYYKKTIPIFSSGPTRRLYDFTGLTPAESWEIEYGYSTRDDLVRKGAGKKVDKMAIAKNPSSPDDSDNQTRKILKTTKRPLGQVAGSANNWAEKRLTNARRPVVAAVEEESYRKNSYLQWEKHIYQAEAGQCRSGTVRRFLNLSVLKDELEDSTTGNIQPPQAERKPTKEKTRRKSQTSDTSEIEATAEVQYEGGNDSETDRNLEIQVDGLESQEQAQKLAEKFAMLYAQRHQQFEIAGAFRDEWFDYEPFSRIDIEYFGSIYLGTIDSVTWTFGASEAMVVCTCNKFGRRKTPDDYPF